MIGQIQHYSMMKRVDGEVIQCTIKPIHHAAFTKMGFFDHIDKLPKVQKKEHGKEGSKAKALADD